MSDEKKNTTDESLNKNQQDTPSLHEYDGIKELTNPSPKWIIAIFYVTITFALIYGVHYFGYPGNKKDQVSEYEQKVAAFEQVKAEKQELAAANSEGMDDSAIQAAGAKLFTEKGCIACHGINGEGNNIGPNLTDEFWLNGCSEEAVIHTITEGKPEKGMTPYKSMLSETQIKQITAYILGDLAESTPANAKEAQGDLCK